MSKRECVCCGREFDTDKIEGFDPRIHSGDKGIVHLCFDCYRDIVSDRDTEDDSEDKDNETD